MTADRIFDKTTPETIGSDDEYVGCTFISCDFSDKTITARFDDCRFLSCNLSLARMNGTMRDTLFSDCKLTGADFSELDRFSNAITFEKSRLDYAVFASFAVKRIRFRDCRLTEASFDNADMTGAVFERCDLGRASFRGANLTGADFSTAFGFAIDPATCRLKNTVFSESGLRGLVAHLDIEII